MPATKKVRVDRALSTNNDSDASVASFLTVTSGAPGFNTATGVISIPNNTSQLTNGAGFITSSALSGYQTSLVSGTSIKTVNNTSLLGSGNIAVQPTLVSGTSIKTINGNSLLGSGDISISAGSSLPSQTGNSGKYLTTDGSSLSWATVSASGGTDYSTATAIKIGSGAGTSQGSHSIAIGQNAGSAQSFEAIAIGYGAGSNQSQYSIAIGDNAGANNQSPWGVAIGYMAGWMNQSGSAIAIGSSAGGMNQGSNAIAIGANAASSNQPSNSIVLNATSTDLNPTTQGFFVAPMRNDATPTNIIYYNTNTKELTYGAAPVSSSGGSSGGSSAGGLDPSQFSASSTPPTYLSSSWSMTWTAPTASGIKLVFLVPPPWTPVVNAGPGMNAVMASHGNINPPWASWYYGNVTGSQIANFGSSGDGYAIYNAYTLHSSTNPATDSNYFGSLAADLNVNTGDVTVMNPSGMMNWSPSNAGYGYFTLNAYSMGGGSTPTGFTPAPGVTAWFDSSNGVAMVKAPPSVWWNSGSGGLIGSFTGLTPMQSYQCMLNGAFFGT